MRNFFSSNLKDKENQVTKALVFACEIEQERMAVEHLLADGSVENIYNTLDDQVAEFVKSLYPSRRWLPGELTTESSQWLKNQGGDHYGCWVYYPWRNALVRLLSKDHFIALRTNRNHYKITKEEQAFLAQKRIGIIGLSVGQAVALTMAMERSAGAILLADFDTLDLSNLNRLRAGIMDIGTSQNNHCSKRNFRN